MRVLFSKMNIRLTPLLLAALTVFSFSLSGSPVLAFDERFYVTNDIIFYNPDSVDCGAGEATTVAQIDLSLTGATKQIYDYLSKTALSANGNKPLSATQASGVMGNMFAESGFNPAAVEDTTREDKGHGLVQWTFGRWDNLQAFATKKGTLWDDLTTQLEFLKGELEGTEKAVLSDREFSKATSPAIAAQRFRVVFERADPDVAHDSKREGAAVAVYNAYAGAPLKAEAQCTLSNGIVAGNLVKTALGLALQTPAAQGMVNQSDARDTYQQAKPKYNPTVDWTDCGGYIATSMIASGVDPDYVKVLVSAQLAYVRAHPEKYQVDENPTLSDLRPGDILYVDGHTTMYTGEENYPSVDASLDERVPSVRDSGSAVWMIQNGAVSARVLK